MKYLTIEYIPYEGADINWFDTIEEVKEYITKNKGNWGFSIDTITVLEYNGVNVYALMES